MRALVLLICVFAGGAAAAQTRTYEGEEAQALRCANMIAMTAVALARSGQIDGMQEDVLLDVSFQMLERHVSGTWGEKRRAMEQMRDRRSLEDTLKDYQNNAAWCFTRFQVN